MSIRPVFIPSYSSPYVQGPIINLQGCWIFSEASTSTPYQLSSGIGNLSIDGRLQP